MNIDERAAVLFPELRPLVAPVMTDGQVRAADISLGAGEGYEALTWLFDFADDPQVRIPKDLAMRIRECLEPEDLEEYAPVLARFL